MKDPPISAKLSSESLVNSNFHPAVIKDVGYVLIVGQKKKNEEEEEKRNNKTDIRLSLCCGTSRIKYSMKTIFKTAGTRSKAQLPSFLINTLQGTCYGKWKRLRDRNTLNQLFKRKSFVPDFHACTLCAGKAKASVLLIKIMWTWNIPFSYFFFILSSLCPSISLWLLMCYLVFKAANVPFSVLKQVLKLQEEENCACECIFIVTLSHSARFYHSSMLH